MKDTLSKINTIGKAENVENKNAFDSIDADENKQKNTFTQEQLDDRWEIFVERLKKKDTRMYSALKSIKPMLKTPENIEISFQNSAILEEYKMRLKPSLISELREALKNEYLEMSEMVLDSEKMERPILLSEKEKLQSMIEKNPALLLLKKKFNLDFK